MTVATSQNTTSATDWSIAYAVAIRRLDSQFMLSLLRLDTWPNLGSMHGDLVDAMKLICGLLEKRPMVGFLVARRLKLPVDKTYALLSVLHTKGHIVTVNAEIDDEHLAFMNTIFAEEAEELKLAVINANLVKIGANVVAKDSGDVLNQLWRVLNTDISWSQSESQGELVSASDTTLEAKDKLSKLWRILDAEITLKKKSHIHVNPISPDHSYQPRVGDTSPEAVSRLSQLWQVLNSEIAVTMPPERPAMTTSLQR